MLVKLFCSSNVTKLNVRNDSSISQLIKTFNVELRPSPFKKIVLFASMKDL